MFRELERKQKAISIDECKALLKSETRGVLSVLGDDNYPYAMPLNHFYDQESGKIYFHTGKGKSHRQDAILAHNKVCFCCYNQGEKNKNAWAYTVKSVIAFGKITLVEDKEKIADIARKLSHKFTQDDGYIEKEIQLYLAETLLLELNVEHISGKKIVEA